MPYIDIPIQIFIRSHICFFVRLPVCEAKEPTMKEYIEAIKLVIKSLKIKEETLEDEINDTFDQVVAIIEERRACLLNQLHSRISSTCEKLGNYHS